MVDREGDKSPKSSEVVFFLGAGASVKAGVPTTYSFVNEYTESIKDSGKKETIQKIVKTLEQWKNEKIDIELLLESLTKLRDKAQEPLLSFYTGESFILDGYYEKEPLINDLKNFIKSKAIVESEEKIRYLESFRDLIDESRPLDIISVNYDTSIEQFCNYYRLTFQDGFDVYWNPSVFLKDQTDIRLYKIHGSVMWYQSDRGGYIKLPVMVRKNKVQLITGENAENLMLYPMQKWNYAEPLLELLVRVKHLLESEPCKFLIIVGYSFRDEYITQILWDVARRNRELLFILIDPEAYRIYSDKLKYYSPREKIPSSMEGRVICLPYLFERVFPYIKNHYLKKIREGFATEKSQHLGVIQGEKPNSILILQYFSDAEYTEKVETILNNESFDDDKYWSIKLEIFLKMAVNLIANGEKDKGDLYLTRFCDILRKLMVDRIDVEVYHVGNKMFRGNEIEIKFNQRINYDPETKKKSGESYNRPEVFTEIIEKLLKFYQIRVEFNENSQNDFSKISKKLENLKNYFSPIHGEKISVEKYILYREKNIPNMAHFRSLYELFKSADDLLISDLKETSENNFKEIVMETEKKLLTEILSM